MLKFQSLEMMDIYGISQCYRLWWTNLIYINNFHPDDMAEMVGVST